MIHALPLPSRRSYRVWDPFVLTEEGRAACTVNMDYHRARGRDVAASMIGVNWSSFTGYSADAAVPGALYVEAGAQAGVFRARMLPIPTGDFDAVAHVSASGSENNEHCGVIMATGVTSGAGNQLLVLNGYFTNVAQLGAWKITNYTTWGSTPVNIETHLEPAFCRLSRRGAAYAVWFSHDGRVWFSGTAVTPTGTQTHVGFFVFDNSTAGRVSRYSIYSYRVFEPAIPARAIGMMREYPEFLRVRP